MKITQLLIVLLSLFTTSVLAQETVGSSGQNLSTSNVKVNFTIGEALINSYSLNGNTILSGYQQPKLKIDNVDINELEGVHIAIFPNPTSDVLQIKWDNTLFTTIHYEIFTVNGKQLLSSDGENLLKIDISNLSAGNYFLKVYKEHHLSNVYKIQKIK